MSATDMRGAPSVLTYADLKKDKLVLSYAKRMADCAKSKKWFLLQPVETIAEQRVTAVVVMTSRFVTANDDPVTPTPHERFLIQQTLLGAKPFYFSRHAFDLMQELAIPDHVVSDLPLPFPAVFITHEVCRSGTDINGEMPDTKFNVDSSLLVRGADGRIDVVTFGSLGELTAEAEAEPFFTISSLETGVKFSELRGDTRQYVRFFAFINSSIPQIDELKLPRVFRHGCKTIAAHDTSVVTLRAIDGAPSRDSTNDAQLERKNRWLVRGHYRAQWYPGSKTHQLIWIDNHVKGPAGAPLKQTVYAVTR